MADHCSRPTDFWEVLEQARTEVARWEPWKQKHEADIYYAGYPQESARLEATPSTDVAAYVDDK